MTKKFGSNIFYVYAWRITESQEVFYIGKGCGNRKDITSGRNAYFRNIFNKHNCEVVVLASNLTEKEAFAFEAESIKLYKSLGFAQCNMTDGGEGTSGRVLSEETKSKIGAANKGNPGSTGRTVTDETREKLSIAGAGKTVPAERRAKISATLTGKYIGRTHSEESRAKMSSAKMGNKGGLGKVCSEEKRAKISAANTGRVKSDETLAKMSAAMTGKVCSNETRAKMSEAQSGAKNHSAKLTEENVIEIRRLLTANLNGAEIGKMFGVNKTTISHIKTERAWKSV